MGAAADSFQPSISWQGPQPGFIFTTGPQGTGYYKDIAPQQAAGVSAPAPTVAAAAAKFAVTRGVTSTATSMARSAAAPAPAAAAVRKSAGQVQQQQQQQQQARRPQLQVPSAKVAAPKPQLVGQGQEVRHTASG